MENIDIIRIDKLTGWALGRKNDKYVIIEVYNTQWKDLQEAVKNFDAICFNHYVDEQDRTGTVLFG